MIDDVLEIKSIDTKQVVVKVNADDALTVALHPYLSSDMAYITVTRGKNHVFTVIDKKGKTWSFSFGESGYTLIGDSTSMLKNEVLDFIRENHIAIDYDGGTPTKATVYYNDNYHLWQLSVETTKGRFYFWSHNAKDFVSAVEDFKPMVEVQHWQERRAVTGITVWDAVNPKFTLK